MHGVQDTLPQNMVHWHLGKQQKQEVPSDLTLLLSLEAGHRQFSDLPLKQIVRPSGERSSLYPEQRKGLISHKQAWRVPPSGVLITVLHPT
jgi:hypothetical protein